MSAGARGAPSRQARKPGRRSGEERREEVIQAAIVAFSERGFLATRTAEIAERAGVSQPYLYALFPDKRALFLACNERATTMIRRTLRQAAAEAGQGADAETLRLRLAQAVTDLSRRHPEYRRFQFQARAAAAGDPVIRTAARENFMAIVDDSVELHHADSRQEVLPYIAWAMLHDVATALHLPTDYRPQL